MVNNLYGNGNGPYFHGNKFLSADAVSGLCSGSKKKDTVFVKVEYNSACIFCSL